MKASTLEGAAFCLMLGAGACADSLGETPGGMALLLGCVAVSGLLLHAGHARTWGRERKRTAAPSGPRLALSRSPEDNPVDAGRNSEALRNLPLPMEGAVQKESRHGGRNTEAAGETKPQSKYFTPLFYRGEGRLSN